MKCRWKITWILLCSLILLFCVPVSAKTKNVAFITNGKISKKSAKPGDVLRYRFKVTDNGITKTDSGVFNEGIEMVRITWCSEKEKQRIQKEYPWDKFGKHKRSINISGKIKIRKGMQPGKWRISSIAFVSFGGEDSEEVYVHNRKVRGKAGNLDLSFADFKVRSKAKADTSAPVLDMDSLKVTNRYGGGKRKLRIKVKDQSPIQYVNCFWSIKEKGIGQTGYEEYVMKYNKKQKCYECSLWNGSGKEEYMDLDGIEVCDIYGNAYIYYSKYVQYVEESAKRDFSKASIYNSREMGEYLDAHPEEHMD